MLHPNTFIRFLHSSCQLYGLNAKLESNVYWLSIDCVRLNRNCRQEKLISEVTLYCTVSLGSYVLSKSLIVLHSIFRVLHSEQEFDIVVLLLSQVLLYSL